MYLMSYADLSARKYSTSEELPCNNCYLTVFTSFMRCYHVIYNLENDKGHILLKSLILTCRENE